MGVLLVARMGRPRGAVNLRRVAPAIWVAYLVVPVAGWGVFTGRPLGMAGTLVIAALGLLWYLRGEAPAARTVTAALAMKLALGATLLSPAGFVARYYGNAEFAGPIETSAEPAPAGYSRVDARLQFGGEAGPDLPVHFTNDVNRFNFYLPGQPDRATLPVSVAWEGRLHVLGAGRQQFYARADGAAVTIGIDGDPLASMAAPVREWRGDRDLAPGFHEVRITLAVAQGASRRFEAGRIVDGREQPFDASAVFRQPASAMRLRVDAVLHMASTMLDGVLLLWVLAGCGGALRESVSALRVAFRPRDAIAVVFAFVAADALMFARPVLHRVVILSGGDDWLTYETMSRDIGLNGLWMAGGAALGRGRPFYYQPLYPYFLAACHWVFGDGLFGIYLAQRMLAGAAVVALWRITARLFGERVGLAGLLTGLVVIYQKLAPWSGVLLTESLFAPLVCIWALLLVDFARERDPGWRRIVMVGAVGGIATLTRSTLMLAWLFVVPALALALRGSRRRWSALLVMVLTMTAIVSLATVRNWVVAREFVPIASSGSVNLFTGNTPRTTLVTPPEHLKAYQRLGLDPYMQMVIEYARQTPGPFLDGLERKALYALGSFESLLPGTGRSLFYAIVWASALAGLVLISNVAPGAPLAASAIPFLIAAAHFATVVAIFPHVYGDRLVLPFYLLLVPYVAVALVAAVRFVRRAGVEPRTLALGAATWLAALWTVAPGIVDLDVSVLVISMVCLAIVCAERGFCWRGWWAYAAFAAALGVTWLMAPSPAATIEYRRQLAFVALVPAVAHLAGVRRAPVVVIAGAVAILAAGAAASHAAWLPIITSRMLAVDRVPVAFLAGPAILAVLALVLVITAARRAAWVAAVALIAGAGVMIPNLQRFASARTALDTIDLHTIGWPAAAALFRDHRWFGAGLGAAASLAAGHIEGAGVMLWFVVSAGIIGSLGYVLIWLRALWITGARLADWRAALFHGMLLGAFAALLDYNVAGGASAAPGVVLLLGVVIGLSEVSDVSTPGIESRPS